MSRDDDASTPDDAMVMRDAGADGGSEGGPSEAGPDTGPEDAAEPIPEGCGDGMADPDDDTEACDDGNNVSGDGCDRVCRLEPGFLCPPTGGACEPNCGDGLRVADEQCDDGNSDDSDGCSRECALEAGWICAQPDEPCTAASCGDTLIAGEEDCDDGNTTSGDGCDADCHTEDGWICVGTTCSAAECGDGIRAGAEQCDDGNTAGGDGCLSDCGAREPYFACPVTGGECDRVTECGDGIFTADEQCDDGNLRNLDGCDDDCAIEAGWVCPGGTGCDAVCGDGRVVGAEQCDDGGQCLDGSNADAACASDAHCPGGTCVPVADDGCSEVCKLEPGYKCETPGASCTAAVCGNGVVEGLEQCDDGHPTSGPDNELGDGCTPSCEREPVCAEGLCDPVCGDGVRHESEDCDDGNRQSFDGCSASCEVEEGFSCSDVTEEPPECVQLPLVLRDFKGFDAATLGHIDMRWPGGSRGGGSESGIVRDFLGVDLDDDGLPDESVPAGAALGPVYGLSYDEDDEEWGDGGVTHGPAPFNQWYHDSPLGKTVVSTMTLCDDGDTGIYTFYDPTFYPVDGLGWQDPSVPLADREGSYSDAGDGNGCGVDLSGDPEAGQDHNFMFTSEVRFWFTYEGTEELTFTGDDDVFVFINGFLVIDLGGVHCAQSDTVVLADVAGESQADLWEGGVYEVVVYQAERNPSMSTYRLDLGNFQSRKSECASFCGDGIRASDEVCDDGSMCEGGADDGADCVADDDCEGGTCVSRNTGEYGRCNADCRGRDHFCGDGIEDPAEECDLGAALNTGDYEGCNPDCTAGPRCGDGNADGLFDEMCDAGDENQDGVYGACSTICELGPRCGDGQLQADEGEQCDDGVNLSPYDGCAPGCVEAPFCGDGEVQNAFGEQCDAGEGSNSGEYGGCTAECKRAPFCGDNHVDSDAGEECDDGNTNSFDGCSSDCEDEPILI